jgi:hypothetical protein
VLVGGSGPLAARVPSVGVPRMKITTACTSEEDPAEAVRECFDSLALAPGEVPSWCLIYHSELYPGEQVSAALNALLGGAPLHGGTSCMGVMSTSGVCAAQGVGLGLFAISDAEGDYGTGAAEIGTDPRAAAKRALERALEHAGRPGELPCLVWMNAAPGQEEDLLAGIEDLLGSSVPVAGGSTADNTVSGGWSQIANGEVFRDSVVLSVLFPSAAISSAFHSGYDPTPLRGIVTWAEGRLLHEIDGRAAAQVYDEWTEGSLAEFMKEGGAILSQTSLAPLGREVGALQGMPFYKLSHPSRVTPEGSLALFTKVEIGDEVVLMRGSRQSLISRAGRVAREAILASDLPREAILGGLVIYCAGCMLTIQDDMDEVASEIASELGGAPFLGVFTFGEQGCVVGQGSSHGNLMISTVVFSDEGRG